jgi:NAD(P)-dependent dehydrogenase (short-subunit alcohol dehydrogenase family)
MGIDEMRTTVITGGGSGIGRAISMRQAAAGDRVIVFERDAHGGEQVVHEIRDAGGVAELILCDVADGDSTAAAFRQLERVDALVNNAGVAHVGNVEQTTPEDLDRLYAVNVRGVYHCLHAAIPKMRSQGGGAILNMASIAAKLGIQDRFAYSMTKGATLAMTLSVARDYVADNIRCNCLCPARVHTPFVDGFLEKNYPPGEREAVFEKLSAFQPIGRMGRPEEVAALAEFLLSDEAGFITGSAYDIDGGATLLR